MKLENLIAQLKDETDQLIIDTKQADGADEYTCDNLQETCINLMVISMKLTDHDSDITNQLIKVHHTLSRMLEVD